MLRWLLMEMAMDMDISRVIPYRFTPRTYQLPFLSAMDSGYKRAVLVWHRRSGKEKTCLNFVIKKMVERVGTYYYAFPELNQGRKVLWDGADKDGNRFIDHFPRELIGGEPNNTEMKIRLKNGSLFQIIGSDRFDAVMGTNPILVVFSEFSLSDPNAWNYFRPILAENGGIAVFNFTPRGENHAYDLFELAKNDQKQWFSQVLTVDETKTIPQEILDQERREIIRLDGTDALYQQEYQCNFSVPIAGAYYADQVMLAYKEGRVGNVPYEDRVPVVTWWDLGLNDLMAIWFTQVIGSEIRVIDYYQNTGMGLPHYAGVLKEKGYIYHQHIGPHDIEVKELGTGLSRKETAASLGIKFDVAPKLPIMDGIDSARSMFRKCWFDKVKCQVGLNALKSYRKQYDEKKKTYLDHPYHDWSSNAADAFRYGAVSLNYKLSPTRGSYIPSDTPESGWANGTYVPEYWNKRFEEVPSI